MMLKILQARLQQFVNQELPDVQAGFRKGRGTWDQTANICWIIEKAREFQKNMVLRDREAWRPVVLGSQSVGYDFAVQVNSIKKSSVNMAKFVNQISILAFPVDSS